MYMDEEAEVFENSVCFLPLEYFMVFSLRSSFSKLKLLVDDVIFFFALTRFRSSYYMVWLDRIYDIVIKDNYTN